MRLTWPLTGRSRELRLIGAAVSDPDTSGIVIRGAAGVGKSRLAREALAAHAAGGFEVRWIVGTSAARTLPLGALTPWARPAGADALELVRGVIAALTAAPTPKSVVIGVDDVTLLDDLSTLVVHQIIQRRLAKVVLTLRDGEPVQEATRELWKAGELDRLDIGPLSPSDTNALVSEVLGGPVAHPAAERLWQLTRGNPLYLRNIVEQEVADRRLARHDGRWTWHGDPVIPPDLVDLVDARLWGLPDDVVDVVDVVAVGEPIELQSLATIVDPAAIEEADRRGLICFEPTDGVVEVRLAHPLYGEARRARVAQTTLRRLRGMVTTAFGRSEHCDDIHIVVRRATMSLDSDLPPDLDLLTRAARGAAWMLDLPLADGLAEAAIAAGGGAEARFIRAFVLSWLGSGRDADDVLAAIDAARLSASDRQRLVFLRAVNLLFTLADPDAAKELVDAAEAATAPEDRDGIDSFQCVYWASMGKPEVAIRHSRCLDRARLPDLQARLTAWAQTVAHGERGEASAAAEAAEAGYPVPVRAFIVIADAHTNAFLLAGRITEARNVATMMHQRALASQGAPFGQIALAVAGQAALGAGKLDEACALLSSAVNTVTAWNAATGFRYRYQILLMTALAMRGATADATAARAVLDEHWHPSWRYLEYARSIAESWIDAGQGAVSEAVATLRLAAETARANGQFAAEVMCLQTATQFGDGSTAARLRQLVDAVEGPRAAIGARFATALGASDGTALDSVSAQYESIGDLIGAMDAAAHAACCFRSQGLRGSGLRCSTRAQELATRCGGASSPALQRASIELPLTEREREIVMLIGAALSNRDIAARLTLSVRTVESHIYKAMAKTGTANREDLAELLTPAERQSS